jgi:hypothetical protein
MSLFTDVFLMSLSTNRAFIHGLNNGASPEKCEVKGKREGDDVLRAEMCYLLRSGESYVCAIAKGRRAPNPERRTRGRCEARRWQMTTERELVPFGG